MRFAASAALSSAPPSDEVSPAKIGGVTGDSNSMGAVLYTRYTQSRFEITAKFLNELVM